MRPSNSSSSKHAPKIIQLGLGGVGQALVRQYLALRGRYPSLGYAALADSSGLCYRDEGWSPDDLLDALAAKAQGQVLAQFASTARWPGYFTFVPTPGGGLPALDVALPERDQQSKI